MKHLIVGLLALAVVATACMLGPVPVAGAADTKGSQFTAAEKDRLKQVVDSFKRLKKTKNPSPAMVAEARKHAAWLKDHVKNNAPKYDAAFKQKMAKKTLTAGQKSGLSKIVQDEGSYSSAVMSRAEKLHKVVNSKNPNAAGIRAQGIDWGRAIGDVIHIACSIFCSS